MEKHNIHFRGVQPKKEWHQAHARLFQKIVDADRLRHSEFLKSDRPGTDKKDILGRQIDQVVRAANSCRQDFDVESTWRAKVEKHIVDRFEQETDWWGPTPMSGWSS